MDPITIYLTLFALAVVMCFLATAFARRPTRACMACNRQTPIDGRRCRHCGYLQGRA